MEAEERLKKEQEKNEVIWEEMETCLEEMEEEMEEIPFDDFAFLKKELLEGEENPGLFLWVSYAAFEGLYRESRNGKRKSDRGEKLSGEI